MDYALPALGILLGILCMLLGRALWLCCSWSSLRRSIWDALPVERVVRRPSSDSMRIHRVSIGESSIGIRDTLFCIFVSSEGIILGPRFWVPKASFITLSWASFSKAGRHHAHHLIKTHVGQYPVTLWITERQLNRISSSGNLWETGTGEQGVTPPDKRLEFSE